MKDDFKKALRRGVAFLAGVQHSRGGFSSLSWPENSSEPPKTYNTMFSTALILDALSNLPSSQQLQKVRSRSAAFLLNGKSENWSFNYWERGSEEARVMPYPDDLDDTFAAFAALRNYDPEIIGGEAMAHAVMLLAALEVKPGGPYRTWLIEPNASLAWRDVDLAVNANVAYFLRLSGIALPGLDGFLEDRIANKNYSSSYYPSSYPIFYYLARAYEDHDAGLLSRHILAHRRRNLKETLLERSLAVSALLRLGQPVKTIEGDVEVILEAARSGQWQALPFCIDPTRDGKVHYSGSAALTAALALEALALSSSNRFSGAVKRVVTSETKGKKIRHEIEQEAKRVLRQLPVELAAAGCELFDKISASEQGDQIFLLPFWWSEQLVARSDIPASLPAALGLASLWGWMAYTAYDDVLDGEPAAAMMLSPANLALRQLTIIYTGLFPPGSEGQALFNDTLERVDAANAWELEHCVAAVSAGVLALPRVLPDFGSCERLAERSLGHALGPLSITLLAGYPKHSKIFRSACTFFISYLSARQLNDDAHDWWEDLLSGRINVAGARVLKRWRKIHAGTPINLAAEKEEMQRLFWKYEIQSVERDSRRLLQQARRALGQLPLKNKSDLEALLAPLDAATKTALEESRRVLAFLETYRPSSSQFDP